MIVSPLREMMMSPSRSVRLTVSSSGPAFVPVLIIALLQILFAGRAYGFPSFLLAMVVLFYCWGPRDLDADIGAVTHAGDRDTRVNALQDLPTDPPSPPLGLDGRTLVDTVFRAALTRWFGVLFWFLLLGASGALIYRFVQLVAQSESFRSALPRAHADALRELHVLLDWPAAQLMTLSMALAADFDAVERVRADINKAGLAAEMESSSADGDKVRARLRVGDKS